MDANDFIHYLQAEKQKIKDWDVENLKKLFQAFDLMSQVVNSTSTLPSEQVTKAFILGMGHRTLEQSGVRLMFQIIETLAQYQKEGQHTDARNEGSRLTCERLVDLFKEANEGFLPSQGLSSI